MSDFYVRLIPQFRAGGLILNRQGETLIINGEVLDLSVLRPGDNIIHDCADPLHPFIASAIDCDENGDFHLSLLLPVEAVPEPHMANPGTIIITVDGPVDLPFATYSEVTEQKVEGGVNIITTTKRWHQENTVETEFVPDPPAPAETPEEDA